MLSETMLATMCARSLPFSHTAGRPGVWEAPGNNPDSKCEVDLESVCQLAGCMHAFDAYVSALAF
jgi:hypothetical protein